MTDESYARRVFVGMVSIVLLASIGSSVVRVVMFQNMTLAQCRPLQQPMKSIDIGLWVATLLLFCFCICLYGSSETTPVGDVDEGRIIEPNDETASLKRPHGHKITYQAFELLYLVTIVFTTVMFIMALATHCHTRR